MIIKRLTMHNFRVYAGTNTFEFMHNKPIVLIGGLNGRGKTTFLEAILIALYGSNSATYLESGFKSYNKYLRACVNRNHWTKSSYIELEFVLNESTNDTYLIRREWDALSKITKEKIDVWQNGQSSSFLTKNWAMFVENILPNALSSFYFFDGEKIAALAAGNTSEQMKESIRSMLGITVLDILKKDLGKCIRRNKRKTVKSESEKRLDTLREERDAAINKLLEIDQHISNLEISIDAKKKDIEQCKKQYEMNGGLVIEQRQGLLQKLEELQSAISRNKEALVNVASTVLPLILVEDLINDIKLQAEDEHNDFILAQALELMSSYIKAYDASGTGSAKEGQQFVDFVRKKSKEEQTQPVYMVSDQALFQLNELSESGLHYSLTEAKKLLHTKDDLRIKMSEIESYLSLDVDESNLNKTKEQIEMHQTDLLRLEQELSSLQHERSSVNAVVIQKSAEYKRDVESYLKEIEARDDADRVIKYSNIAITIIDAYSSELQKKKTGLLSETITNCYKKLSNKQKLIHRIAVDSETLDIKYLDHEEREISKSSLSAGETQLMVIAILWALAICSKKKLPVIIDTPLSRLDSKHREAIITTYFPNASDQTIILSTDTEINHDYYDLMKDFIGDEYTLEYCEETRSTSIQKGYFGNQ